MLRTKALHCAIAIYIELEWDQSCWKYCPAWKYCRVGNLTLMEILLRWPFQLLLPIQFNPWQCQQGWSLLTWTTYCDPYKVFTFIAILFLIIDISIIMITHHCPTDYHYHYHNLAQYDGGLVAIPDNYFEHWWLLVMIILDAQVASPRHPRHLLGASSQGAWLLHL